MLILEYVSQDILSYFSPSAFSPQIAHIKTKVGISTGTIVEEGRAATPVRERYKFNPVYGSSNRASFSGHYQVPIKIKWLY